MILSISWVYYTNHVLIFFFKINTLLQANDYQLMRIGIFNINSAFKSCKKYYIIIVKVSTEKYGKIWKKTSKMNKYYRKPLMQFVSGSSWIEQRRWKFK